MNRPGNGRELLLDTVCVWAGGVYRKTRGNILHPMARMCIEVDSKARQEPLLGAVGVMVEISEFLQLHISLFLQAMIQVVHIGSEPFLL